MLAGQGLLPAVGGRRLGELEHVAYGLTGVVGLLGVLGVGKHDHETSSTVGREADKGIGDEVASLRVGPACSEVPPVVRQVSNITHQLKTVSSEIGVGGEGLEA